MERGIIQVMRFSPAVLLALPLLLTGCTDSGSQSSDAVSLPSLPNITAEENLRDELARTEFAIMTSANTMDDLATECQDCGQMMKDTSQSASTRLDVLGGMWEPWDPPQSGEHLPSPPEVADAPTPPAALVGYMLRSAEKQLDIVVETGPAQAALYAQTLAGRMASARVIAVYYGIDTASAVENFLTKEIKTSVGEPLAVSETMTPKAHEDLQGTTDAVLAFDCLGTESGRTTLAGTDASQSFYNAMLDRQDILLSRLDDDPRPLRCSAQIQSQDGLFSELVGTDITLIGSSDPILRNLGRKWLEEDLETWSQYGTVPTITPGSDS